MEFLQQETLQIQWIQLLLPIKAIFKSLPFSFLLLADPHLKLQKSLVVKQTDCTLIKQFDLQRSTQQNFAAQTDYNLNDMQNFSLNYW
jgi:hypothetical protein